MEDKKPDIFARAKSRDAHNFFAVDLGATSGRTILCSIVDGELYMHETNRFPNRIIEMCGHCYWDIYALYSEIIAGLKVVAREGVSIKSIGIDTWGVDFTLVGSDGEVLRAPYCYRDPHTQGAPERFFADEMPRSEVYDITGIEVMNINSLYQLYTLHRTGNSALAAADKVLFTPDALNYLLTGNMVTEYTIASTSQMLNPRTKRLDERLLEAVGLTPEHFAPMVMPGTVVGTLKPEVQRLTGLGAVPVVAVAGHDTASAVAAVPALRRGFAYLSSGTWSLMGIEVEDAIINERSCAENFTNEGGVLGTTRFLKNLCGMWLLERCRQEWKEQGIDADYGKLIADAKAAEPFRSLVYPDAKCFANPASMLHAIGDYCRRSGQPVPATQGEVVRCIFDSLTMRYREVFMLLQSFAPFELEVLHIIGGGSQNDMLNQLTCDAVGVPVVAGPSECTAIGNVMLQAMAQGMILNMIELRKLVGHCVRPKRYTPQHDSACDAAFARFKGLAEK